MTSVELVRSHRHSKAFLYFPFKDIFLTCIVVPKFQGESFYKNKAIVDEMKKIAAEKGCSLAQLALAWVAAQGLITIPGTTKPKRLEENWASRDVELSDNEVLAIRKLVEANKPEGKRFSAMHEAAVGH